MTDADPDDITVENAYKTRWVWYHTILAIEIFTTNMLLLAILVTLIVKL
jgi:hypothetical protein